MGDRGVVDAVRGGEPLRRTGGNGSSRAWLRRRVTGNGFATRFAEDFGLFAELGLTHHRLSVEWARVEPEEGAYDQSAIAHYREMLSAA